MTDPDHGTPHGTSSSSIFFVLGRKKNKHAQRKQIELKVVALKQKQNSEDFFYRIHTIWEYFIQFRLSVKCTDGKCSCNHFTFVQLYIFKSICYFATLVKYHDLFRISFEFGVTVRMSLLQPKQIAYQEEWNLIWWKSFIIF